MLFFQIYFEYLEKTYIAYMKGDDEFRELDDELVQSLSKIQQYLNVLTTKYLTLSSHLI